MNTARKRQIGTRLADRFRETRALTAAMVEPLSEADATLQSMEDASPAKWHLGHTNWFFETFLLRDHVARYRLHNDRWPFLFNSYYEAEGKRIGRFSRGMLSRPAVAEIREWRSAVDDAMEPLLDDPQFTDLIELGIAHEQQHQELLLTDIKHALFQNPLGPAMFDRRGVFACGYQDNELSYVHQGGSALIGHDGAGFAYDNEGPQHQVVLTPFELARRLINNAQWQEFIDDGGYRNPALWLSDGWAWVQQNAITAPLYWHDDEGQHEQFSHYGWVKREPSQPVTHISYYEADAFATWAGARLPTEFEWEVIAREQNTSPTSNRFDGTDHLLPEGHANLFGDCWQFTRSAYLPYPRYKPAEGAIGEYNGKFMSGQVVLRGASCATPRGHSRPSYRNFFYPHQRWQFTGLRLAKDI